MHSRAVIGLSRSVVFFRYFLENVQQIFLIGVISINVLFHYLRYGTQLVRKYSTHWGQVLELWRRWQATTALIITSTGCFSIQLF